MTTGPGPGGGPGKVRVTWYLAPVPSWTQLRVTNNTRNGSEQIVGRQPHTLPARLSEEFGTRTSAHSNGTWPMLCTLKDYRIDYSSWYEKLYILRFWNEFCGFAKISFNNAKLWPAFKMQPKDQSWKSWQLLAWYDYLVLTPYWTGAVQKRVTWIALPQVSLCRMSVSLRNGVYVYRHILHSSASKVFYRNGLASSKMRVAKTFTNAIERRW